MLFDFGAKLFDDGQDDTEYHPRLEFVQIKGRIWTAIVVQIVRCEPGVTLQVLRGDVCRPEEGQDGDVAFPNRRVVFDPGREVQMRSEGLHGP